MFTGRICSSTHFRRCNDTHVFIQCVICLRLEGLAASDNAEKLALMSRRAASLELRSEVVATGSDPDSLAASLEAVAGLRTAIAACKGLRAREPLASAVERIISFLCDICAQGFPEPDDNAEAAWRLMTSAISCGYELVEIGSPDETASSEHWKTPLNILCHTMDVLKAQLPFPTAHM